jgi:hypothetical protein
VQLEWKNTQESNEMLALSSVTSLAQLVLCIAPGKVHSKELQKCISSLLMLQRARHRVDAPGAQMSTLASPPQQRALTKLPSKRAEKLLCSSTHPLRGGVKICVGDKVKSPALTKECICMRFLMRQRSYKVAA